MADIPARDINVLFKMPIEHLYIYDMELQYLKTLSGAPSLAQLDIVTDIKIDFLPINDMAKLENLTINSTQKEALYEAVPNPWFNVQ